MSKARIMLKAISEITGCGQQPTAYLSRHSSAFLKQSQQEEPISKRHKRYNISDRSMMRDNMVTATDMSSVRRECLRENRYFLAKINREKQRCFAEIENIRKQCQSAKKKNSVIAQTYYDHEKPYLWRKVKAMYQPVDERETARYYCDN